MVFEKVGVCLGIGQVGSHKNPKKPEDALDVPQKKLELLSKYP